MSTVKDLGAVSAYAIAVKYGYVGTEEEWVNEQEAKRKQAVEAASSAAINAATATQAASEAKRAAENAMSDKDAATQSAAEAKTYAENAEAITGIEIAKKNRAGIVKGGENHIAEDGTLQFTVTTTERTIQDSYAGGLKINEIGGASEQVSTTGAQLYDVNGLTVVNVTSLDVSDDGYTISAVGGSNATNSHANDDIDVSLIAGKTIYVKCDSFVSSQSDVNARIEFKYKIDDTYTYKNLRSTGTMAIEIPEDVTEVKISLVCNGDTVLDSDNTLTVKGLMVAFTDTDWEPFTGNAPSPSPDYPQEIESVVVSEVKTNSANFFNSGNLHKSSDVSYQVNGNEITVKGSSAYASAFNVIKGLNGQTVTFYSQITSKTNPSAEAHAVLKITHADGKASYDGPGAKVTIPKDAKEVLVQLIVNNTARPLSTANTVVFRDTRVVLNKEAWTEYNNSSITLSSPITLNGIGDNEENAVKDRIVRKDGVWGVERKLSRMRLDSSLTWRINNAGTRIYSDLSEGGFSGLVSSEVSSESILCTHAVGGIWANDTKGTVCIGNGMFPYVGFSTLDFPTVEEFVAWLDAQTDGVFIIAPLKEPTFEPLPTADQIALHSLKSFDGVTYISTDSEIEPVVEVEVGTSKVGGYTLECCNDREILELENDDLQSSVSDLMSYVGYTDETIYGVEVDFTNKKFTRLAGAAELSAGSDFDSIEMFGGRKRCNVADDGTVNAYYGDTAYAEDGSNGQVMVEQPKFYYKVVPLELEKIQSGKGYHMRKVRYYVSETPRKGFKLHPAFIRNGVENDFIYLSAYEGCTYDTSASAYKLDDAQDVDWTNDVLASIAGAKPTSGLSQSGATRNGFRAIAAKRGEGWSQQTIQSVAATQILFLVEYASFNIQEKLGAGVTTKTDDGATSMTEITGATTTLGNKSGQVINTNGYSVVAYRGEENPFGNIWKWVDGINVNNGTTFAEGDTGTIYVADHDFADNTDKEPYTEIGFSSVYLGWSYISAFGYSEDGDWLFFPTEGKGNSSVPVGDCGQVVNPGWRFAIFGASWDSSSKAGLFCLRVMHDSAGRYRAIGGRLLYVPDGTV